MEHKLTKLYSLLFYESGVSVVYFRITKIRLNLLQKELLVWIQVIVYLIGYMYKLELNYIIIKYSNWSAVVLKYISVTAV